MSKRNQELEEIVRNMVRSSGNPEGFDAEAWVAAWMKAPLPALGGETPLSVAQTPEGFERVKQIVLAMQSGAYM